MNTLTGWTVSNLEDLVHINRESLNEQTPRDCSFYYIDIASASEGKLNFPSTKITFRESPSRARRIVRQHDVLMSTVRPNLRAFAYFDRVDDVFIASTGFAVLTAREQTDPRFVLYAILSDFTFRQIDASLIGSNYPAINSSAVHQLKIVTPPKPEQAKIAEILSVVDRAIEKTEALIHKQHRIKTGLMQDLLTRGIDEHGKLRTESTHSFKDSPLGRIPIEWADGSLESVASFVTSGSRGWAQYYSNEGAIFLRIGNLTRAHINLRLDDLVLVKPPISSEGKRTSVQPGDLLISITADLGIIGMVPPDLGEAYVNQHISLIRLKNQLVNPRFVGWFLSSSGGQSQFEAFNESGAKAGLNLPTVKRLIVPLPSLAEQSQIAKTLDESTACANAYIERGQKLRSLKTALMQDLLTGKKSVTPLLEPIFTH